MEKSESINDKIAKANTDITDTNDPRLQFMPKEERKKLRGFLKQKERARRATQVTFKGLYLNRSLRGGGLVMHIPKDHIPDDGLHLTISNQDILEYLEDAAQNIRVFEITKGDEPEQKTA